MVTMSIYRTAALFTNNLVKAYGCSLDFCINVFLHLKWGEHGNRGAMLLTKFTVWSQHQGITWYNRKKRVSWFWNHKKPAMFLPQVVASCVTFGKSLLWTSVSIQAIQFGVARDPVVLPGWNRDHSYPFLNTCVSSMIPSSTLTVRL